MIQPQTIMPCGKILGSTFYIRCTRFTAQNIHISMWIVTIFLTICSPMLWICFCYFLSLAHRLSFLFNFIRWFVCSFRFFPRSVGIVSYVHLFLQRNSIHMIASPHRSSPIFSNYAVNCCCCCRCRCWHWLMVENHRKKRTKCGIMRK